MTHLLVLLVIVFANAQVLDLLSAPWTPFFTNQTLNLDVVEHIHKLHVKNGVTTVWLGGNMAQWTSMTKEDRFALFAAWVNANDHAPKKLKILPMIGSATLETACDLTRMVSMLWSVQGQVEGLAIIGPAYLDKPPTLAVLIDWLVHVDKCQLSDAPKLPFYYYHIPGNTGINFKMGALVRAAKAAGLKIAGIKFVSDDVLDFMDASQELGPEGKVYWAPSPKLRAMPFGATKFVLAEDWMGPYMTKIAQNFLAGKMTEAAQWEVRYDQVGKAVGLGNSRAVDAMLDPKADNGPPRLPLVDISSEQREAERNALHSIGFFDFIHEFWKETEASSDPISLN